MKERIAIIDGIRTPFCKAGGAFNYLEADDLGTHVAKEILIRSEISTNEVDEVYTGNVAQPAHAANVARVIALKAGLSKSIPAYTVHRNCASGFQAITSCATKIVAGEIDTGLVVATESMSNIPLIYPKSMAEFLTKFSKCKTFGSKLKTLTQFKFGMLKPKIGLLLGLTDPYCDMIMGKTAEVLAREFQITRQEQDEFALMSHKRAQDAMEKGRLGSEILPIACPPKYANIQKNDDGIRLGQSIEALQKLKPYFEKPTGSVTVGNSSQVTDGAAALILMKEKKAKSLGLKPLGYLKGFAYAGCDPHRMGLGPVFATNRLVDKLGMKLSDFKLIEINEAFAAQVIACKRAFASDSFAKKELGKDKALGEISSDILNINGGAIAYGHPVGATGARLTLTLLKELKLKDQPLGLASLCVGGGQGGSLALEVE